MEEFKERQRAMWAAGDYGTLSEYINDVGEYVVERAGVDAGHARARRRVWYRQRSDPGGPRRSGT